MEMKSYLKEVVLYITMNEQEPLNLVLRNENREILSNMELKGMKILEKNSFFTDLSDIMSDDKMKNFFDKYFKNEN